MHVRRRRAVDGSVVPRPPQVGEDAVDLALQCVGAHPTLGAQQDELAVLADDLSDTGNAEQPLAEHLLLFVGEPMRGFLAEVELEVPCGMVRRQDLALDRLAPRVTPRRQVA